MERYDVIVIGAGPAGCACAIHSARNGMSVAIIERHPATRDRPGETLHPGIEPLLHQLGVAEWVNNGGFARPLGVWIAWQHERRFVPFGEDANGPWRGFQIPGARLDSLLLEAAKACNVVIRQPCHAKGVISRHQRVIGVQTNEGVLHSTYLVDASGANGWLARQLGLKLHRYSAPLMAFYGYVQIEDDDERPPEGMFADPFGWYWVAHLGEGRYNWTRLRFEHAANQRANTAPLSLTGINPLGKTRGADVTWRIYDHLAGDGYFITGDAAAVLDPAASHGVLKAIMSGTMAAHGILQSRTSGAQQHAIAVHYHQWLQDWFDQDVKSMRALYAEHPFPPAWLPVS